MLDESGAVLFEEKKFIGATTNNVAEYTGLITALELAAKAGAKEVEAYLDSEVVVRQMTGVYRVREEHLRKLYDQAKKVEQKFLRVTYTHLPRENPMIRRVDRLVNQALDEEAYS